jgi:hypothetical protein
VRVGCTDRRLLAYQYLLVGYLVRYHLIIVAYFTWYFTWY